MYCVLEQFRKLCWVFLFLFFYSNSVLSEIVIRADKNDFPATYIKNNQWQGMDIELLTELLSRAKLDLKIDQIPFQRSLHQMKEGRVHLIPNLVKNKERSAYMNWLGPTRTTCIGLVVQDSDRDLPIQTLDDLIDIAKQTGKKVGYLKGASYSDSLDYRLKNDPRLTDILYFLPDAEQFRQMLKLGRIMGYIYDAFEIRQRMIDEAFAEKFKGLALHQYHIEDSCSGAYVGVSKKLDRASTQRIFAAYKSMDDDGYLLKSLSKWMGEDTL